GTSNAACGPIRGLRHETFRLAMRGVHRCPRRHRGRVHRRGGAMTPSSWLFVFLKQYERFRPTAYCATPAERAKGIWTIGYGHTLGVKEGDTCTLDQAQRWLEQDTAASAHDVGAYVKVPLNQNQFDALCSLRFNIGGTAFAHSTLVDML